MTWNEYLKNSKNHSPRPLMREALAHVHAKEAALDLDCGALNDTAYILEHGFEHVDAVDSNPSVEELLPRVNDFIRNNITFIPRSFSDFVFPPAHYDFINAQYSLPFIGTADFRTVIARMKDSAKSKGVFAGQFFGLEDGWTGRSDIHFCSREEVESLFNRSQGWSLIKLDEFKGNRMTAAGTDKYCHVYDVIAVKD